MKLWKGQPFGFENFSTVVVTSHSSCAFHYLFSSANISPVRFVLHLQDWWCVGKRGTSFLVNKLWLIYLPPSLWPLTMKKRGPVSHRIGEGPWRSSSQPILFITLWKVLKNKEPPKELFLGYNIWLFVNLQLLSKLLKETKLTTLRTEDLLDGLPVLVPCLF